LRGQVYRNVRSIFPRPLLEARELVRAADRECTTASEGHGHVRINTQASARGRCLRRNELAGLDLGVAFSLAPLLLSQVEAPGHQPGLRLPLRSVDMAKGKLDITGLSAIG